MGRTIRPRPPKKAGEKWVECVQCGTTAKRIHLLFNSGSVEPTADETLTGATSADTGVVVEHQLYSGSFAGGDARGTVVLKNYTGLDKDSLSCFQKDENINGSTGGSNMMTAEQVGAELWHNGKLWPLSQTTVYEGKRLCNEHARWRAYHREMDKIKLYLTEEERGRIEP